MTRLFASRRALAVMALSLAVLLTLPCVFAQETTAAIQGNVKDATGAVVPKANVEVTSPALIGVKKGQTDSAGYYRFDNLPPGDYTITVSATGFKTYKQAGITLAVGREPSIDVTLQVGGASETVEVTGEAPLVDVTQSKVATNIPQEIINSLPKGRSFQSLIQLAPGARVEPLEGNGYEVQGASNSETAYLVDGQDTGSVITGATNANVPMEFIQEVQIKTSGFEAEYGGALGGVVNAIQKRGTNNWHGSLVTYYSGSQLNPAPNRTLRRNPGVAAVGTAKDAAGNSICDATHCIDSPLEYYQAKKDKDRIITPGIEIGGPLFRDKLWMFVSSVPEFTSTKRTLNMNSNVVGPRDFLQNSGTYYSLARLDYLLTEKIRLYAGYQTNYSKYNGGLPGADSVFNQINSYDTQNTDSYNAAMGYVYPQRVYNFGADFTITPSLVATTRYGSFYNDTQSRGLPVGTRYTYTDSNYVQGYQYQGLTAMGVVSPLTNAPLAAQWQHPASWANISPNRQTVYDRTDRNTLSQDLAFYKKGWGVHNFKFGYNWSHMQNDVVTGAKTTLAYVAFGMPYQAMLSDTVNGVAVNKNCQAISQANITQHGTSGVNAADTANGRSCVGLWGTINFSEVGTTGMVAGNNHSFYAQDAWTVGHGVTLNIGVRMDKEHLPSYNPNFLGIDFGFAQKMAPRLGGAWDIKGNGKMKLYGSFGYFYDIMKYNLPRGSFGGDYWHDCVYALDTPDWTSLMPVRGSNGHFCNPSGGANFAGGSDPAGLRFIENKDFRMSSNDPASPGGFGKTGLVDPNLKPMKQHEYVAGFDWALRPSVGFEARYTRKRLDRTIEDTGVMTTAGEQYYITNPGIGPDLQPLPTTECAAGACPNQPKAMRRYDGIELRLTKTGGGKWGGSFSYTYSKFAGNYTGLTATDVSDSVGRNGANTDRAFDEPFMQFDSHGRVVDGLLSTDRPNTFKGYGYYRLKWWKFNEQIGIFQIMYQGTPLSSYIGVDDAPVFLEGRGLWIDAQRDPTTGYIQTSGSPYLKRTPWLTQTDFDIRHEFNVSKTNEAMKLSFEANAINIFNQHAPVVFNSTFIKSGSIYPEVAGRIPAGSQSNVDYQTAMTGYDYVAWAKTYARTMSSLYGQPQTFQSARSMRLSVRFTF